MAKKKGVIWIYLVLAFMLITGLAALAVNVNAVSKPDKNSSKQVYPKHKPYGKGIGAKPGRVVWSHNSKSVNWNGKGYWWKTGHFNEKVISKMFQKC